MAFNLLMVFCVIRSLGSLVEAGKSPFFNVQKRFNSDKLDQGQRNQLAEDQWFIQKLDHFNPVEIATWKQRYFVNEQFSKDKNGPVFLMIGGEGEASPKWMTNGQWIEYAKKFNALCFQLEHRYYGDSHPTSDMSVKNLVYLTSEQALADLANFIASMNEKYKLNSETKWILFGGSYPGSLAAWMRVKYPHLVHGSVSSSGPLVAKVDFSEYFTVVVDALRTTGESCVEETKKAFQQLEMISKHRIGQRSLSDKFKLCDSIEGGTQLDFSSFYESLASHFAGVVQYNKDNRISNNTKMANVTIDVICRLITDQSAGIPIDRLATINALMLEVSEETCLDYKYDNQIAQFRNVTWSEESQRAWMFQTCNEFGFYQTSSAQSDIFTNNFPVEFFLKQCEDVFGSKFNAAYINEAARQTNIMYGGLGIETSRTVFIHGSIDPWHALGIIKTQDTNAPAIYIEGTAHCANMYPPRDSDLPALKAAREQIFELLTSWLKL